MINSVIHGDCLEEMKKIKTASIDMILCDLPYGTTACKWDSIIPFKPLWEQYERIIKDNGAIVLTASQPFTSALVMSNPILFKYEWIWEKNAGSNFGQVKYQPMKEHESVLIFGKGKVNYCPIMQERKGEGKDRANRKYRSNTKTSEVYGNYKTESIDKLRSMQKLRYPSSVQKFNRERGIHPTQKPVELFKYLIKTYTNGNTEAVILDNCAGSGTTAIACLELAAEGEPRNYILIEKEKEYFDIINRRIADHKPQMELI